MVSDISAFPFMCGAMIARMTRQRNPGLARSGLDLREHSLHLLKNLTRLLGVECVYDFADRLHFWIERIYLGRFQASVQLLQNFIAFEHGASRTGTIA